MFDFNQPLTLQCSTGSNYFEFNLTTIQTRFTNLTHFVSETTTSCEEFTDSIRMLVLLENGEQRLITFTLPKEACTIQEILEQVNVPFTQETNIQVTEANTNGINYVVTVGNVSNLGYGNEVCASPLYPSGEGLSFCPKEEQQEEVAPPAPSQEETIAGFKQSVQDLMAAQQEHLPPELPKLIPGKLAVCSACGYTGEDFNKCRRYEGRLINQSLVEFATFFVWKIYVYMCILKFAELKRFIAFPNLHQYSFSRYTCFYETL